MHYLTIDGMMSGTGVRDAVEGGYLNPGQLGISSGLQNRISHWLAMYEDAHFRQYGNENEVEALDSEGLLIAHLVSAELPGSKVDYFSSARMLKVPPTPAPPDNADRPT